MRWWMVAIAAVLAASRARAEDWKPPSAFDVALLAAAETSLAIDTLQTLDIKNHRGRVVENNPGPHYLRRGGSASLSALARSSSASTSGTQRWGFGSGSSRRRCVERGARRARLKHNGVSESPTA